MPSCNWLLALKMRAVEEQGYTEASGHRRLRAPTNHKESLVRRGQDGAGGGLRDSGHLTLNEAPTQKSSTTQLEYPHTKRCNLLGGLRGTPSLCFQAKKTGHTVTYSWVPTMACARFIKPGHPATRLGQNAPLLYAREIAILLSQAGR